MSLRPWTGALLILPTLVAGGWWAHLEAARANQPTLRIAIAGYDPRDLLRGHYLEFRLDLPGAEGMACACLRTDPADPLRPAATVAQCAAPPPPDCPAIIAAPRQVFRYYAPEEQALALEAELAARPGGASVLVHFHGDGAVSFSGIEAAAGALTSR